MSVNSFRAAHPDERRYLAHVEAMRQSSRDHLYAIVMSGKSFGPCDEAEIIAQFALEEREDKPQVEIVITPRQIAARRFEDVYVGTPCRDCGSRERRTASTNCVVCKPKTRRVADQMLMGKVSPMIIKRVCASHNLSEEYVMSGKRDYHAVACRQEIWNSLHSLGMTMREIARIFGCDHSLISDGLRSFEKRRTTQTARGPRRDW